MYARKKIVLAIQILRKAGLRIEIQKPEKKCGGVTVVGTLDVR